MNIIRIPRPFESYKKPPYLQIIFTRVAAGDDIAMGINSRARDTLYLGRRIGVVVRTPPPDVNENKKKKVEKRRDR